MNLAFLGDALDHWKGSLFESLHKSGVLRNFAVDPMASDWAAWQPEDVSLFARLLRVDESKIVRHKVGLSNRKHYFDEIEHTGDLFLDPDTGIATGKVKRINQYVKPLEIERLLRGSERLLAVYQHVRAQSVFDASTRYAEPCTAQSIAATGSYESGTVAMLFLSRSHHRTAAVATHFAGVLGRHALGRVRRSSNGAYTRSTWLG